MWDVLPRKAPWWKRIFMQRAIKSMVSKMEAATYFHSLGHKAGRKEIERAVLEDIGIVDDFLQNKSYLMGERVCLADCTIFAFLVVSQETWKVEDLAVLQVTLSKKGTKITP